ncbi:MAG: hypothetical protein ACJ75B_12070 [Flavisolibacter sp.]
MTVPSLQVQKLVHDKCLELGIAEEIVSCSLEIICRNRNLMNAMDHTMEIDDYIYRAILKNAFEKRKARAEEDLNSPEVFIQNEAQKDLRVLSREELTSDAFYRAVLPLIVKVLQHEPILRLHAEEASAVVLELADFKRRHRSTSLTEIIVKRCGEVIEAMTDDNE